MIDTLGAVSGLFFMRVIVYPYLARVRIIPDHALKVEPLKPISYGHCGKPGHIITNCLKLVDKTHCDHCGVFNHESENYRIAKNKLTNSALSYRIVIRSIKPT